MSHAEERAAQQLAAESSQLEATVRQLVLMKETGPKSAAWHRARVGMIWRLQRQLEQIRGAQTALPETQASSAEPLAQPEGPAR